MSLFSQKICSVMILRRIPLISFRYPLRRFSTGKSNCGILSCPACHSKQLQIKDDLFCCQLCPNREGIDYFKLLGIPRTYSVDLKEAETRYRDLQKTVHPDRINDEHSRTVPEGYSALLNKAISVIKSPTERAMHLLYILDGCAISERDMTRDPALLMEMMELNESVDDCGHDKACLEKENAENTKRLIECEHKLESLFSNQNFREVRVVCERMHFLGRIRDTISTKLVTLTSSKVVDHR